MKEGLKGTKWCTVFIIKPFNNAYLTHHHNKRFSYESSSKQEGSNNIGDPASCQESSVTEATIGDPERHASPPEIL